MKKKQSKQIEQLAHQLAWEWMQHAIAHGCDPAKIIISWDNVHPCWKKFFRRQAALQIGERGI